MALSSKMSSILYLSLYCVVLISVLDIVCGQAPHRRFEYKYSFKPPYLAQKDGSVPFWEYGGNAIASSENVRLAPSLRSQKGAVWTKQPVAFDWWDVDVMFRVTGRGRIGADGLAFWYTANKGDYNGDVFGSSDKWVGLGVLFDSFDNDNKHNNPYIMAVVNDGTKSFDHQSDGATQLLSGCLRDFRNKPFPTRARIEYYLNTLTVYFHNGMSNNHQDYELCFRAENVVLPKGGYFGLSAATGALADDHDAIHFLTTSLHPPGSLTQQGAQIAETDQNKLSEEYREYQQKLDQQKEDYRREHPDAARDKDADMEDWFESDNQRELRQIFQGQGQIFEVLRDLHKKVDEVLGKQMNSLSMLTAVYSAQQGQAVQPLQPGQAPPPLPGGLPIGRHEWDNLIQNHNLLVGTVNELKSFVLEVSRKSDQLITSSGRQGSAQPLGYDIQALTNEMRDGINHVKQNVAAIGQKVLGQPAGQVGGCPNAGCITTTVMLAVLAGHLTIMFLYSLYKEKKELQAKKFY